MKIYSPAEAPELFARLRPSLSIVQHGRKRVYNTPQAFDIETSSFIDGEGNKRGVMYVWQLGIAHEVIVGRTWEEYFAVLAALKQALDLSYDGNHLRLYVHNLAFEFSWLQRRHTWKKVFAIDRRRPIYATTDMGIDYYCSYKLSNYSLQTVAKNLSSRWDGLRKMVGDLDYDLVRHPETPLTDAEMGYCVNDVLIVMAYIDDCIQQEKTKSLLSLPITKTGFVRRFCREKCLGEKKSAQRRAYSKIMRGMKLYPASYSVVRDAYAGGFTHANALWSTLMCENVTSYDFTSSYPAVLIAEKYPMSTPKRVRPRSVAELEHLMKLYCVVFEVAFENLESTYEYEHYLSYGDHKRVGKNVRTDNGRVVSADFFRCTLTDVDWDIVKRCYKWTGMRLGKVFKFHRAYLPKEFVMSILELYGKKTTLKGVAGQEAEYMGQKEMVNSTYGMAQTAPLRDTFIYDPVAGREEDGWWRVDAPQMKKELHRYNKDRNRFSFYAWQPYVTAYARRNLWTGIMSVGADYIYSDTDSLKIMNADKHQDYFKWYNSMIRRKLDEACAYHKIDPELTRPKTIKGVEKPLGVWDFDGQYSQFKTLGQKRYMVQYKEDGEYKMTVAGLKWEYASPWLVEEYGDDAILKGFVFGMHIPADITHKILPLYIDSPVAGVVRDYTGKEYHYKEESAVYMGKVDYELSVGREYYDYLAGIHQKE